VVTIEVGLVVDTPRMGLALHEVCWSEDTATIALSTMALRELIAKEELLHRNESVSLNWGTGNENMREAYISDHLGMHHARWIILNLDIDF
jgi:hypothetical protein